MEERTKFRIGSGLILAVIFGAILLLGLSLSSCTRPVWMEPEYRFQFNAFNASVQDWDQRCRADPNTCAESLSSMAAELHAWTAIVNGIDPNEVMP